MNEQQPGISIDPLRVIGEKQLALEALSAHAQSLTSQLAQTATQLAEANKRIEELDQANEKLGTTVVALLDEITELKNKLAEAEGLKVVRKEKR